MERKPLHRAGTRSRLPKAPAASSTRASCTAAGGADRRRLSAPPGDYHRGVARIELVREEDLADLLRLMRGYCEFYGVSPDGLLTIRAR